MNGHRSHAAEMRICFSHASANCLIVIVSLTLTLTALLSFVLRLTRDSIPLCSLVNQYLTQLAKKFPCTKFLKSVSTTCIPNYPDKHLPTIFIYFEEDMKKQYVGPLMFGGMNLKIDGKLSPTDDQGPVSRKSQKLFGPEKPSVKLPTACFGKPIF